MLVPAPVTCFIPRQPSSWRRSSKPSAVCSLSLYRNADSMASCTIWTGYCNTNGIFLGRVGKLLLLCKQFLSISPYCGLFVCLSVCHVGLTCHLVCTPFGSSDTFCQMGVLYPQVLRRFWGWTEPKHTNVNCGQAFLVLFYHLESTNEWTCRRDSTFCHITLISVFMRKSSYCFQRVLAIAILSVHPSVCLSVRIWYLYIKLAWTGTAIGFCVSHEH